MIEMTNGTITFDITDEVATATLNRPDSLNSMTNQLMLDLTEAIRRSEDSDQARVLVLTGAGRGFCSGADLRMVAGETDVSGNTDNRPDGNSHDGGADVNDPTADAQPTDPTAAMDAYFHPAIRALKNCALPTVARINGVAAGAGFGLAMACDIGIAARSAFFVATFGPRLGIVPDLGTTWNLPLRAGRARALGLAMLGRRITADQAAEWGLIWQAVEDDDLDNAVAAVTGILKRSSAEAMTRIRSAIDSAAERSFSEQLDLERDHQAVLIPLNMAEGAAAFLEKREPRFSR